MAAMVKGGMAFQTNSDANKAQPYSGFDLEFAPLWNESVYCDDGV